MTNWVTQRWNWFWFEPSTPVNLAICRILLFGGLIVAYPYSYVLNWGSVPDYFWHPIHLFRWLHIPTVTNETIVALTAIHLASMACSCIGLFTRTNMVISTLLATYLFGIQHNYGRTYHEECVPIMIMAAMCFSRCADAYSVDRWIAKKRSKTPIAPMAPSAAYTWPIRLIWVYMSMAFFAAGLAKIDHGGWVWFVSDQMKWNILSHFYLEKTVPTDLGLWVAKSDLLCKLMCWYTVISECAGPVALISTRWRMPVALSWFALQMGIWLMMGVFFKLWFVCYIFWFPWDKILARVSQFIPSLDGTALFSPASQS